MLKKELLFYIVLFILILAITMATTDYFDNDLWARLIAGMGVIDGGHVLKTDFLSYTPVHTWWDHEWGSGVIFYAFLKFLGPYSLIILQAVLMFGIFFIASRVVKMRSHTHPFNIMFYFFALVAALETLNRPIRCHMFTFLLFTLFIYLLEKVRKGNNKLLYILPVIILFWNNIHGGVVSGLGLIFMYALGEFLNKKPFKKYIYTLIACCAVLFINPWGYDYIKFLLMANTMPRTFIVEWWSIFHPIHTFDYPAFKFLMFTLVAGQFIFLFKQIKSDKNWFNNIDKVKYIVIIATLYLSISHIKLLPFFIITSICFIYEDFYELIKNIKLPLWKDKVVYGLLIFMSLFTFISKDFSLPVGMNEYPVKEVEFIKQNKIGGKILTNFGVGSYVAYKLYPQNLIFMDGRYEEVYPDYMILLLKQFYIVSEHWDELLIYLKPDVMILEKNYPIYEHMKKSKEWKVIYEGDIYGVFVPYETSYNNFVQPSNDINYYKNNLFTTDIKF